MDQRLTQIERRLAEIERVLARILEMLERDHGPDIDAARNDAVVIAQREVEVVRQQWAAGVRIPTIGEIHIGREVERRVERTPEEVRAGGGGPGEGPVIQEVPEQNEANNGGDGLNGPGQGPVTDLDQFLPSMVAPGHGRGNAWTRFRRANLPIVRNMFPHLSGLQQLAIVTGAWANFKANHAEWRTM